MKKMISLAAVLGLCMILSAGTAAARKSKPKPKPKPVAASGIVADAHALSAVVDRIDEANRKISLKDSKGNLIELVVSPGVPNFEQLRTGDEVKVSYFGSIGVQVRVPEKGPASVDILPTKAIGKAANPVPYRIKTGEMTAVVAAVDLQKSLITVKTSEGSSLTFPVDKGVNNLKDFKKGSGVVLTYSEATALALEIKPRPEAPNPMKGF